MTMEREARNRLEERNQFLHEKASGESKTAATKIKRLMSLDPGI